MPAFIGIDIRRPKRRIRGRQGLKDSAFLASAQRRFEAGTLTPAEFFAEIAARGEGRQVPARRPPVKSRTQPTRRPPVGGVPPFGSGDRKRAPSGALGPFGEAVRRRKSRRPGDASIRPRELRARAARLRAQAAAQRQ